MGRGMRMSRILLMDSRFRGNDDVLKTVLIQSNARSRDYRYVVTDRDQEPRELRLRRGTWKMLTGEEELSPCLCCA